MIAPLRSIVRIVGPRTAPLVGAAAALRTAERSALFFGAAALVRVQGARAGVFAAALAALFVARTAARTAILRRARAALLAATVSRWLGADVLRAAEAHAREPQGAIVQGLTAAETLAADAVPGAIGDAAACVLLGTWLAVDLPARDVAIGAAAIAVAAIAVGIGRRAAARSVDRANAAQGPYIDALLAMVPARLEVVAAGRETELARDVVEKGQRWSALSQRADAIAAIAGRLPVIAAACVVAVALFAFVARGTPLTLATLGEAAVFVAAVPAFAGLARAVMEVTRTSGRVAPLVALLEAEQRPVGGGRGVPDAPTRIECREVSFSYDARAARVLDDLSFAWGPGEILAFAGPNGAGKSTCMRVLLGLARPDSGGVKVGGVDLFELDLRAWRRRVAYVAQRPFLPDRATVREAMQLLAREASDARLERALADTGLWPALRAKRADAPLDVAVSTLSAGQRQRLVLARAIAEDAPVLLLDEPDANLDVAGVELVAKLARAHAAGGGMVAMAAHGKELLAIADRVVSLAPSAPPVSTRRAAHG